jgi:hypothetical protein
MSIDCVCHIACCCQQSRTYATHAFVEHVMSIVASIVLLIYDVRFLWYPHTCLWSSEWCRKDSIDLHILRIKLRTDTYIHWHRAILIELQIVCAIVMIGCCLVFIGIYLWTCFQVQKMNVIADLYANIELGRIQAPPAPYWPASSRVLPASSEF